jgi:hypothetical protein
MISRLVIETTLTCTYTLTEESRSADSFSSANNGRKCLATSVHTTSASRTPASGRGFFWSGDFWGAIFLFIGNLDIPQPVQQVSLSKGWETSSQGAIVSIATLLFLSGNLAQHNDAKIGWWRVYTMEILLRNWLHRNYWDHSFKDVTAAGVDPAIDDILLKGVRCLDPHLLNLTRQSYLAA